MKRVVLIGGGPAGLYGGILLRKALPRVKVEIYERNRPDDTFGWGVVFFRPDHVGVPSRRSRIARCHHPRFPHWDAIDVHFRGETITSNGHGFCGIGRKRLLNIFQERARSLGVEQHFQAEVDDLTPFADADLIVAADGVNSKIRTRGAEAFQPDIAVGKCSSSGSARTGNSRLSLLPSNGPSTAGSKSTRISSAKNSRRSSSRRARRPGGRTASTASRPSNRSPSANRCSPRIWAATA